MTFNPDPFNTGDRPVPQVPLPNSTAVLVLGIVSIFACCCYGVPGLICSVIALVLANSAKSMYYENPSLYTKSSYSNMNAGRICAIITLVLSILFIVYIVVIIATIGWEELSDPSILERYGIEIPV